MNTSIEQTRTNNSNFLKRESKVIRCPKCKSVFIEDDICESCSFKLNFNLLGKALSKKSYFTLKSNYSDQRSFLFKLFTVHEE